ncbi:hypothetical protein CRUP_005749 [Coryphaenoides rupestris]|nr:hypothetical protein CRUP_005749 [Coryphaenoides rupestris]
MVMSPGYTPLHLAAIHSHQHMVLALINTYTEMGRQSEGCLLGRDVDENSSGVAAIRRDRLCGYTPLHLAAIHSHQHMVLALINTYSQDHVLVAVNGGQVKRRVTL